MKNKRNKKKIWKLNELWKASYGFRKIIRSVASEPRWRRVPNASRTCSFAAVCSSDVGCPPVPSSSTLNRYRKHLSLKPCSLATVGWRWCRDLWLPIIEIEATEMKYWRRSKEKKKTHVWKKTNFEKQTSEGWAILLKIRSFLIIRFSSSRKINLHCGYCFPLLCLIINVMSLEVVS